ncbi:MAG: Nif3-like dinuclear metal center hexameric protein [Phycisphaeraceae bacterium]|nr:Nif3-like dinuclear metal center hexameric protein [Phycisphaeraceae bacterium]
MKLRDVLDCLRQLAPESLAEEWDRVGLHVGDPEQRVQRGMLCIDLTEDVMREAMHRRVDMIVAYHPPIFDPLRTLTTHSPRERIIRHAIAKRIAIYSPHTALDAAAEGLGDWLAEAAGPFPQSGDCRPIKSIELPTSKDSRFILVTFVPPEHADRLRNALSNAGAGEIGKYTECSFSVMGEGTFLPGEDTAPTIGLRGRFERVRELRLEMVCPSHRMHQIVRVLRQAHPYEAPVFDLYRPINIPAADSKSVGQGRLVNLARPMATSELIRRVKRHLGVSKIEVARPQKLRFVRTIGFVPGAGGSLLKEAGQIDAFVTGEMRHHEVLAAKSRGQMVLLAGHTQTERPYLPAYRRRLENILGKDVAWMVSRADVIPSKLV